MLNFECKTMQNQFLFFAIVICVLQFLGIVSGFQGASSCLFGMYLLQVTNHCATHLSISMCFLACTYVMNDIKIYYVYIYMSKRTVYCVLAYLPRFYVLVILFGLFAHFTSKGDWHPS